VINIKFLKYLRVPNKNRIIKGFIGSIASLDIKHRCAVWHDGVRAIWRQHSLNAWM